MFFKKFNLSIVIILLLVLLLPQEAEATDFDKNDTTSAGVEISEEVQELPLGSSGEIESTAISNTNAVTTNPSAYDNSDAVDEIGAGDDSQKPEDDRAELAETNASEAEVHENTDSPEDTEEPEPPRPDGWSGEGDSLRWYQGGAMAASTLFEDPETGERAYDPATDAWYWFDEDGTMARGKDVFIPADASRRSGKWVRYDAEGRMVKGEDLRYGGWYYFEPVTGEMQKGFSYVREGGKWCYYDPVTGQMQYGERAIDGGWYYLDPVTGAVDYEWAWIPASGKWVYYDPVTGRMQYGLKRIDGAWYYLNLTTGQVSYGMTYVPEWNTWRYFARVTGRWNEGQPMTDWNSPSMDSYPSLSGRRNLNISVDIANQVTLIKDGGTVIYAMISSTGVNDCTPRGNYRVTGRGSYFYNSREGMGGRYYVQFFGDYLFHSVPIDRSGSYIASEAEKLGRPASHGCVRLTVPDAQWLFNNVPNGTPVYIY